MERKRGYRQYCGLATALDHVGDRWTLLIVRELLIGPRRYSDIRANLPGIATNLLAERLRDLERDGIVARRVLPPPAGSTVYELTAAGRELEGAVSELVRWGGRWLPGREDDTFRPEWLVVALRAILPARGRDVGSVFCELRVDGTALGLTFEGGGFTTSPTAPERPDVVVEGTGPAILGVASGGTTLDAAVESGLVRTEGSAAAVSRLRRALAR